MEMMKKLAITVSMIVLGLVFVPFPSSANEQVMEKTEKQEKGITDQEAAWAIESLHVARDYVEGLDKNEYSQSWHKGDPLFQATISEVEWTKSLMEGRKPLGRVLKRTLKDQRIGWNPNRLPKGAYMVVEFATSFEKGSNTGELLTLRRGEDGKWRLLTYQVN
jgi:Protein of unknown function (DUF4019)